MYLRSWRGATLPAECGLQPYSPSGEIVEGFPHTLRTQAAGTPAFVLLRHDRIEGYEHWAEPYTAEVDQVDLVNMGQYNVQEAKTRLSELLHMVERGDEVVLARGGRPVAKLVKIERPLKRTLGFLGPLEVPEEAFEPMNREELAEWEQPLT